MSTVHFSPVLLYLAFPSTSLSICSFVADTVSMNVGPVLFFSSFCDIVFSSMVFFGAVDMHVAVANKTNNNIEMTV